MQTKVWDKDAVQQLLERNAAALARAVLTIYERQTAGEKNAKTTSESNGRGFSGHDAAFLSSIAERLPRYDNRLTAAQRARVLPKMKRYWRQLLEEIEAKGGQVHYGVAKRAAISLNRPDKTGGAAMTVAEAVAQITHQRAGDIARSQFA